MITRLVSPGNVIIDIVAEVPELPERCADVLASAAAVKVGGGFNLMAAAARQGLEVAYGGALGHGPLLILPGGQCSGLITSKSVTRTLWRSRATVCCTIRIGVPF